MKNLTTQNQHTQPSFHKISNSPNTTNNFEGTQILIGLGLSERQVRIYLALLRVGVARARVVSGVAGVVRQEVYRLLLELQQLGLVRKNLTVPVSYCAVPFPEAVKMLFAARAGELTLISQKAKHVTEKYSQKPLAKAAPELQMPCFGEVCEGEGGKKYGTALETAEGCVELVCGWGRFRQLCFYFEAELKAALGRGVRVRVVVEKPPKHSLPKWICTLNNPVFELKTLPTAPAAAIAIFDGAEVAVAFDGAVRLTSGPDLWSRHVGLVAVCRGYFDRLWAVLG
jgi:sugar-specific transcriptional regulator TrmB